MLEKAKGTTNFNAAMKTQLFSPSFSIRPPAWSSRLKCGSGFLVTWSQLQQPITCLGDPTPTRHAICWSAGFGVNFQYDGSDLRLCTSVTWSMGPLILNFSWFVLRLYNKQTSGNCQFSILVRAVWDWDNRLLSQWRRSIAIFKPQPAIPQANDLSCGMAHTARSVECFFRHCRGVLASFFNPFRPDEAYECFYVSAFSVGCSLRILYMTSLSCDWHRYWFHIIY